MALALPLHKAKSALGKTESFVWLGVSVTAFILVWSKTGLEFNGNQSDWKHFAEERELVQTSDFSFSNEKKKKKLSRKKCQGVNEHSHLPSTRRGKQSSRGMQGS